MHLNMNDSSNYSHIVLLNNSFIYFQWYLILMNYTVHYTSRETNALVTSLGFWSKHLNFNYSVNWIYILNFFLHINCGGQLTPKLLFRLRGWAYGPITQSEDDSVSKDYQIRKRWNGVMGRGQVYLWWTWPYPRRMFISELLSEVARNIPLPLI